VCGAGGTVLAAIGVGMLEENSLRRACRLATKAGGRQVAEFGIAAVNPISPALLMGNSASSRLRIANSVARGIAS
jgi:bifunctional ADP-heptose synthase (sugar kinase/adenylyltransferase)